jgi:hypothetical protein
MSLASKSNMKKVLFMYVNRSGNNGNVAGNSGNRCNGNVAGDSGRRLNCNCVYECLLRLLADALEEDNVCCGRRRRDGENDGPNGNVGGAGGNLDRRCDCECVYECLYELLLDAVEGDNNGCHR